MSQTGLMCLVALAASAELDAGAVRDALGRTAPRSDVRVEARRGGDGERGLFVRIDRQEFAALACAGRIPEQALDDALKRTVFWPGRHQALAAHNGFIAVAAVEPVQGHGLVRAQAVALTRLAAAIAETVPVVACCWPSAATAVPPERLTRAVREILDGRWPIDMWIGFVVLPVKRGGAMLVGARSSGADVYFGAEIEVEPFPTEDAAEPMRILLNTAGHLMAHGAHLRNGQPIQVSGERRMILETLPRRGRRSALIRLKAAPPDGDAEG